MTLMARCFGRVKLSKKKKMSTINEILFPIFLFIVYLWIALQFLAVESVAIDEPVTIEIDSIEREYSQSGLSREWLETQSLANLKAIGSELCITVTGDKRSKINWINAIVSNTPTTTVLAKLACHLSTIDLCFA